MVRTTLKSIADTLGLSISTVSRALSDHYAISEETKMAVRTLAEKLNYKVNTFALGLKKRRSNSIGIIVPDLAHHYFSSIISGVQQVLFKQGFSLLICQSNESEEQERKILNTLISSQVDGILISVAKSTHDYSHYESAIDNGVPVVFFDRICEELKQKASSVSLDDHNSIYLATKSLLAMGRRRIAILYAPQSLNIGRNRLKGYKDALLHEAVEVDQNLIIETDMTVENSQYITYQLLALRNRPDAILVTSGLATIGCLLALKEKGFEPDKEIKVAGILADIFPGYKEKGLLRMYPPTNQMGIASAELLISQIKNPEKPIQHLVLDVELRAD